jgi:argininosuccinate lyase
MAGMMRDLKVNEARLREAASTGFSTATDLADWLVREANLPFRDAHHVTGGLVKLAESKNCELADLSLKELQAADKRITKSVYGVLSVDKSVASRTSLGGTAPTRVRAAAKAARKRFLKG